MRRHWFLGVSFVWLVSLPAAAWAQSPDITVSLVNPNYSYEHCRVTNDVYSGINNLTTQFDMGGADQGISADDPLHRATWVFFGDAAAVDGNAWYGSHGANAQGYLDGVNYANPLGLCGSLQLVTEPGLVSSYVNPANGKPGMVFAPDLLTAPPGDLITNYLFHSPTAPATLPNNPSVLPKFSPSTSGIS